MASGESEVIEVHMELKVRNQFSDALPEEGSYWQPAKSAMLDMVAAAAAVAERTLAT